MKNLKETILTQINDQLTLGLSALSYEQEKIQETVKKLSSENTIEGLKKLEDKLKLLERRVETYSDALSEQKQSAELTTAKFEEILKILKTERKSEGATYESNQAENERIKSIESRLESCLSELLKTKERFEETLARKLDSSIFETFKMQERTEVKVEKKPVLEGIYIERREEIVQTQQQPIDENVDERLEVEKRVVNNTVVREFQKNEKEGEGERKTNENEEFKSEGYADWLAQNKESVTQEIEKHSPTEMKRMLEGAEVISEIKANEDQMNSEEIQRDFESINNAMQKKAEIEVFWFFFKTFNIFFLLISPN